MHPTSIRLRVSLSSTELSRQARKELIDPLDGEESLFCWCPCACAVLAVNDLLRAEANDTKYLLASIVWVAISIWFCETDHLSLEEQKHQWNNTVELLMAGRSPLLQRSFNDDVSRALTDGVAPAFDEEVALDGGPDEGYIGAAFEAIRNYTVRDIKLYTIRTQED